MMHNFNVHEIIGLDVHVHLSTFNYFTLMHVLFQVSL